jgi:hypothetical protein
MNGDGQGMLHARGREMRNVRKILVGKPERKRSLGRSKRRGEDIIKTDHRGIGYERVGELVSCDSG